MLRLLLDEHISPRVAKGLRRQNRAQVIYCMTEWHGGAFLGRDDAVCLRAAEAEHLTLVTYDRRTIPPLLKRWAEEGRSHGGVVLVDEKTISAADIGGLIRALFGLAKQTENADWTNRIYHLRR